MIKEAVAQQGRAPGSSRRSQVRFLPANVVIELSDICLWTTLVGRKKIYEVAMPDAQSYEIYKSYVKNVRELSKVEREVIRVINRSLKTQKKDSVYYFTKIYTLLYSIFAEANFLKLIHTPHGLAQRYVNQILNGKNLVNKWEKCIELAFIKFDKHKKGSEVPNKKQELIKIVKQFIIEPSNIRNKLAHGQLKIATNKYQTQINTELSNKIDQLDSTQILRLFEINKQLVSILEDLIESPHKAHYNHYYTKYQRLKAYIKESEGWTIDTKLKTKSMKKKSKPIRGDD